MNILLLNDDYFLPSLKRQGHSVFFASLSPRADLRLSPEPVSVLGLIEAAPFRPEVVIFSDSIDVRSAFLHLEQLEIPLIFYGVDAPMNAFWQRHLARVCDLACFDQESAVLSLRAQYPEMSERFHWLPLAADQLIYHQMPLEKKYDISFVGSINKLKRPKRSWIINELRKHFNIQVFDGENCRSLPPEQVAQIYNESRLVLNENLFPGVNLRLFEVMACGTCLLTEEGDGSWRRLFTDGEHLVSFNSENLIRRTRELLQDDARRERIAAQGMARIHEYHTVDKRAEQFIQLIASKCLAPHSSAVGPEASPPPRRGGLWDQKPTQVHRSYSLGQAFSQLSRRWPNEPVGALKSEATRLLHESVALPLSPPFLPGLKDDYEAPFEPTYLVPHNSVIGFLAESFLELGAIALEDKRVPEALDLLQRAKHLRPSHPRILWTLFWCLRELEQHDLAAQDIVQLSRLLNLNPPNPTSYENLASGRELTAQDYLELGLILLAAGYTLEPGFDETRCHPCRWNAFDAFQKAIALNPHMDRAYLECARLLETAGCPDFALLFLEKAVELNHREATLRLKYVELLLTCYRRAEGCRQLQVYLSLEPPKNKWEILDNLKLSDDERRILLNYGAGHEVGLGPFQPAQAEAAAGGVYA